MNPKRPGEKPKDDGVADKRRKKNAKKAAKKKKKTGNGKLDAAAIEEIRVALQETNIDGDVRTSSVPRSVVCSRESRKRAGSEGEKSVRVEERGNEEWRLYVDVQIPIISDNEDTDSTVSVKPWTEAGRAGMTLTFPTPKDRHRPDPPATGHDHGGDQTGTPTSWYELVEGSSPPVQWDEEGLPFQGLEGPWGEEDDLLRGGDEDGEDELQVTPVKDDNATILTSLEKDLQRSGDLRGDDANDPVNTSTPIKFDDGFRLANNTVIDTDDTEDLSLIHI